MPGLQDQIAKYEIQIVRTGDGAAQAAKEFANTDLAAGKAARSGTALAEAFHGIHETSLLGRNGLHSLNGVLLLAGEHHIPAVTEAIMTAHGAMGVMRGTAAATGASLGTVAVAAAGVAIAVYTMVKAWQAQESAKEAAEAQERLKDALEKQSLIIQDHIHLLAEKHKISEAEELSLYHQLDLDQRATALKVLKLQGSKEENDAVQKLQKLREQLTEEGLEGTVKESFANHALFLQRRQEIADLAKAAGGQYNPAATAEMQQENLEAFKAKSALIDKQRLAHDVTEDLKSFETDLTITTLQQTNNRISIADREYQARKEHYADLYMAGKITDEKLVELNNEALAKKLQAEQKVHLNIMSLRQMEVNAANEFASGLANAIVSFANGTKSAKEAFRDFAVQFLSQIAQMIIQTELLAVVKTIAGLAHGGVVFAGTGAVRYAASGLAGVSEVSSPTYFPKFNVVAGEAGREMLTVLARPRMMNLGGMEAVVGQAGNNRLAITNANDLERRGGAGGHVVIELRHSDQANAKIIESAISGAEVRITQNVQRHTALRTAVKRANA